jgi:hypothetical protein
MEKFKRALTQVRIELSGSIGSSGRRQLAQNVAHPVEYVDCSQIVLLKHRDLLGMLPVRSRKISTKKSAR